jgi:hypothetical protein
LVVSSTGWAVAICPTWFMRRNAGWLSLASTGPVAQDGPPVTVAGRLTSAGLSGEGVSTAVEPPVSSSFQCPTGPVPGLTPKTYAVTGLTLPYPSTDWA